MPLLSSEIGQRDANVPLNLQRVLRKRLGSVVYVMIRLTTNVLAHGVLSLGLISDSVAIVL